MRKEEINRKSKRWFKYETFSLLCIPMSPSHYHHLSLLLLFTSSSLSSSSSFLSKRKLIRSSVQLIIPFNKISVQHQSHFSSSSSSSCVDTMVYPMKICFYIMFNFIPDQHPENTTTSTTTTTRWKWWRWWGARRRKWRWKDEERKNEVFQDENIIKPLDTQRLFIC